MIFTYDTLDSTNEEAKRMLASGKISAAPLGQPVAVCADTQTAGKGTQGRQWVSPKGAGIYFSIIHTGVTPSGGETLVLTSLYTQAAGLACAEALKTLFGLDVRLKPVNDLYALCPKEGRHKKLGGILVESMIQQGQLLGLVSGIGINLSNVERKLSNASNAHPDISPVSLEELLDTPKWLQVNHPQHREEFLSLLIERVDYWYQRINTSASGVGDDIVERCARISV
ncbi:MAG: biotin--[acetyl-CoA-carboxylase] ligase [Vampirovibrionales bacterium]|nr:biotin--[acetyl-CoA-carboxylase] ligase [Vampirovibrionales bacterium]